MKIGVVTFWNTKDNFGQILQLYAFQVFMRKCKHTPVLIRTSRLRGKVGFTIKIKQMIKSIMGIMPFLNFQGVGGKHFDLFFKTNVSYTDKIFYSPSDFTKKDLDYDAVICGSDVVWGEGVGTGDWGKLFFLGFVPNKIKKISYAASFGASELSEKFSEFVAPMIKNFDAISVREDSGIGICAKLGRPGAITVCDPTLLLHKEEYESLFSPQKTSCQTSFAYFIGRNTDVPEQELLQYLKGKKWILSRLDCQNYNITLKKLFMKKKTISEWLMSYYNSNCIFTNSFHGTIFALIFNKPFLVFLQKGSNQKLNNRIEALLARLGVTNRIWNSNKTIQEQMEASIDWVQVNKQIDDFRNFSINWLKKALES